MKLVFSRKGFDSTAGGAPSPILDGCPLSLPIPSPRPRDTRYGELGLGEAVASATRGRIAAAATCHDDPMFADGRVWFGQCGAAQGHLLRQGVGPGDVFLFFGLFADAADHERHHRLFGWLEVAGAGSPQAVRDHPAWREPPRPHPHLSGEWPANNAIWFGRGAKARSASPSLRLTVPDGPLGRWRVPPWLKRLGLTYHARPERWRSDGTLDSVRRGQEFVCDIGEDREARAWLAATMAEMAAPTSA